MKKLLIGVGIVLVVLFAARNPGNAAALARAVGTGAIHVADGLGTFAANLAGGKH